MQENANLNSENGPLNDSSDDDNDFMSNLPRADISRDVEPILLKISNKKDWRVRKTGAEDMEKLLKSKGMRVQSKGLGDLFSAMKARLGEKNKGLLRIYIKLSGTIAEAVGKDIGNFM